MIIIIIIIILILIINHQTCISFLSCDTRDVFMLSLQFALTPDLLLCLEPRAGSYKSMSIMDLSSVILSTYFFIYLLLNFRLYDSLKLKL